LALLVCQQEEMIVGWPRDTASFPEPLSWNGEPGALPHDREEWGEFCAKCGTAYSAAINAPLWCL
jgi:hypothetical protein